MKRSEIPALPSCSSDKNSGSEMGAPGAIELVRRGGKDHSAHCNKNHITSQFKSRRNQRKVLPAAGALKRKQGPQLKRHMAKGLINSWAAHPRARSRVKKLTVQADILSEENLAQPEAHLKATPMEENSHGTLVFSQPPEPLSLPWPLPPLDELLTVSFSGELPGSPDLHSPSSALTFKSGAVFDPLLLLLQALEASDQTLVCDPLEWQQKLEAAEALITLRDSSQVPSDSIPLPQSCDIPVPGENRGHQLSSSTSFQPATANSVSLLDIWGASLS